MYFVNTNLAEKIVQVLLPVKELSELPHDSPNFFKTSRIDCYLERPNPSFRNGKYSVLNEFCHVEISAYYTVENKSNKTCKYQPDELDDNLIEINHGEGSYPKIIKLMISGETM